jgi:hypothetical protein
VTGGRTKGHNTRHNFYPSPVISEMFKSRKVGWAGHVTPMGEIRNAYKNLSEQLKVNRHVDRG